MLKKFSFLSLVLLVIFFAGCNNEKGNNLYIGVEGSNERVMSVGDISRDDQLTLINNIYKGLFELDIDKKVVPVLAESYSYSEDGKKMYIKIKEGFSWSDGSSITAENVALGLKNNIGDQSGKYSYQFGYLNSKIEDNIKVNEEGLVEISLSKGFTDFEKVLAMPIFYPVMNTEDPLAGPFSGEFIVEKNSKDKITLVARDKEKALAEKKTESIIFEYSLGKEKLVKGFQNKDFDIIFPETVTPDLKGEKIVSPGIELLWINGRSGDLKNIEARKAIYQSLEKINGIYPASFRENNQTEKTNMTSNHAFQNPELRLLVLDVPEEIKVGEKIKGQLSKKGALNIEILAKPLEEYFMDLRKGNFDLALEILEGDYYGKNAYFEIFKNPIYNPLNVSGINVPAVNSLQNEVNKISDSPEREAIFADLEKEIIKSVSGIILSEGVEKEIYIQRIKNVGINSIYNYHDYSNIKY